MTPKLQAPDTSAWQQRILRFKTPYIRTVSTILDNMSMASRSNLSNNIDAPAYGNGTAQTISTFLDDLSHTRLWRRRL